MGIVFRTVDCYAAKPQKASSLPMSVAEFLE